MEMALKTNIVQVTNVAPVATLEQMSTLFGFLGKILDIKLYPSDDYIFQPTSRVCYIHFAEPWSVGVAQHLTNTVFIDRALIVVPIAEDTIPDETKAMALTSPSASVPSLIANSPVINQSHVWLLEHESKDGFEVEADDATAKEASTAGISREKVTGVGSSQVIQTMDPRLSALGLPQYPPLPANMDPLKVEEIRRTVYVGNLDSTLTAEQLLKFFNQIGEVKYVRMAGDETQPTRFAFVEFTDQASVASALQYNGVIYGGRPLKINHSNNAIVKPQAKSSEAAQREIEEAMKRVREAQSLITAAIEPELVEKKSDRSRSRSRSRRRSGSRSRKRSRSRSHSRKRSSRRSHSRHRSRSRRHRSRSREHKSRSRSKERKKRSVSPRSRRDKSRSHSSERSKKRHKKSRSRSRSKSSTRSKTSVSSKTKDSHKSEKKSKEKSKEKSPKKEKSSKTKDSEKEVKPKVEPQPEEKVDTPKVVANTSNEELGPPILTPEIPFKDPNNFVKLEAEDTVDKTEFEKRPPSAGEKIESADSADDTKEDIDTSLEDRGAITSPGKENEFKVGELDVDLRMIKPVEKVSKKERSSSPRRKSRSPNRASRSPSYRSRSVTKRHSRSPSKRRSRSPVKKWSRSPSKRRSKSPVKKRSRSPVRRVSRSPSKRTSRSPSKRPSRSPSRKRSHSRSRKRSRTPSKLSRRRISPSPSPIRRRSRSPGRRRRSRSGSRVYPRKRRISRSPRRRSRTPRRRTRSPSYRRRSRSPRRSRTPVRRRRSPSRTSRTTRLSRSPRRRSRSPRRRTRTRSRSGSPKRDSRHKKRKDKDRDHSRDRKKKKRDEDKERSGSNSKDMKVVRNYDEEEKGYDSSHDAESKRSNSVSKPREDDPPKPPVDSDASDRRSGDMDLDSD